MIRKINEKAINGLYYSNASYRSLFRELANMTRQDETVIDELENRLQKKKEMIPRRDIVTFFKSLEEFGAGEFLVGRKGHSSRFRWAVDSVNIGTIDVAFPQPEKIAPPPIAGSSDFPLGVSALVLISHRYQLRADLVVTLQLPSDITSIEAQRLCQFLNSLPLQGPVQGV